MYKASLLCMLFCLLLSAGIRSQPATLPEASTYTYHPPHTDKESWQRLNLWLSSTYLYVAKEAQADQDSCLLLASRSLGMSRFSILAEGFGNKKLFSQSHWIDIGDTRTGIRLLSKTSGKEHLQQLLLLGSFYAFQPRSNVHYKDSATYYLTKAITESKTVNEEKLGRIALCLLGKIYLQAYDNKGDSILTTLINQCKKAGDKETEVRAIAYRGIYTAPMQNTFQRKLTDLQQAADLYHSQGNIEGEINVLTDLGYVLSAAGQQQQAYSAFLKALSLEEAIQFPYIHYNTDVLTMITFFQGKFGEPLRYARQTIKVAESCRDSIGWAHFYSRLAYLYSSENRQQESVEMAQKAVARFIIDRNPAVYHIMDLIVNALNEEGRAKEALALVRDVSKKVDTTLVVSDLFFYHEILSDCYINLNELDSAEIHIKKMDSLETKAEAVRGPFRRSSVNDRSAIVFLKRGQYSKAKEYLDKHFRIPSYGHRTLTSDLMAYRLLITTDSALGDNASVISHYKEYTKLLDSNFKVTKIRQAEELQVIYETQERESHITALNQKARQTSLVNNLSLAGIAAVIIIAGLLYRQNRLKQKNNKIITLKNDQLQDLLADKEWLLKEIHHRVKNNLEIIMSLLNSQSKYIYNDAALSAINDSQRRVQTISLIHQKLYQSENTSLIDMRQYIDELISYLKDSFDTGGRIVIEQDIAPVRLDVAKAIPLGLIINEAIVNAVKYAFPVRQKGLVRISLKYSSADHLLLNISDNGIGLPSDVNVSKRDSLGFSLMRGLTRQLDGVMSIENNNGVHLSIRFNPSTNLSYEYE